MDGRLPSAVSRSGFCELSCGKYRTSIENEWTKIFDGVFIPLEDGPAGLMDFAVYKAVLDKFGSEKNLNSSVEFHSEARDSFIYLYIRINICPLGSNPDRLLEYDDLCQAIPSKYSDETRTSGWMLIRNSTRSETIFSDSQFLLITSLPHRKSVAIVNFTNNQCAVYYAFNVQKHV